MTTIAASLDQMAADTRVSWTEGDLVYNTSTTIKICRIGNELIGTAGDVPGGVAFLEWYRAGSTGRRPKLTKDFSAIRIGPDGIWTIDGRDPIWIKIDAVFFAIGSGARYAQGAMEMGASPERAVEVAMKYDPATGGNITRLKLKE